MDNYSIVLIDGTNYYVESDRVNDLAYIDGHLVNVSNSSITLVSSFSIDSNTYPRINCSGMRVCTLRRSSNYEAVPVSSSYILKSDLIPTLNFESIIIFLLLFLIGAKLIWKN